MPLPTQTGFNPLRWNCAERGCFNTLKRPKIEFLAEALPRKMAFSDVDAITEYKAHFLMLEWKSYVGNLPVGQRIMFERLTAPGRKTVIFIVVGNAETMEVSHLMVYARGQAKQWTACDLEALKQKIREWVKYVDESTQTGRAR